ncbi:MAG: ABC transporter substrate-binding protein [Betaproteobacteria bacterium]|nr:ABC transporter substrate-binding protein [Betaproteobacteria bacterium]
MSVALVYGIPTDTAGLQLRLGIARGFFREQGLDLSLRTIFGGPESARAYETGELKIGELGTPPAITAIGSGAHFKIVASSVRRRAVQYFVAAPAIRAWAELRGKTLGALSIGSCSYWFTRQVLQHHGLDPDTDVKIVGLGTRYPGVIDLFRSGELAGAVLSEPNVSIGESGGAFHVMQALTDPAFCPDMQWNVVVAGPGTLANEPGLIQAVLRGCQKSYHYAADHRDEWIAFGADYFGITRETMAGSIAREFNGLHFDGQIEMRGLQQAIDLQTRLGAIKRTMRAQDIVDLRFLPAPRQPKLPVAAE